jgi:hypothetical protein
VSSGARCRWRLLGRCRGSSAGRARQASIVNVPGAATGVCVATSPLLPLNVDALLASPLIAPVAPRVTPVDTAPSSKPTESTAVAPVDSPNRK